MNSDRLRDLWARSLSGEDLPPAEQEELLAALRADERLRKEFLDDAQLHGALRAQGRARQNEDSFLRAVAAGSGAVDREGRFIRKLEGRIAGERRSWKIPALVAAGVLAAAAFLVVLLRPEPSPEVALPKPVERPPKKSTAKIEPPRPAEASPDSAKAGPPPPEAPRPEPPKPEPEKPPPPPPPSPPTPAPPRPEPPKPPPPPEPPAPTPAPPTVTAVARVEGVVGEVTGGREIFAGQAVETVGAQSQALVVFGDGTRLDLAGDSAVRDIHPRRVTVARGVCAAEVKKQPQPMQLLTPHGEVNVLGTRLRLGVEKTSTLLEVAEGRVQFRRLSDGRSLELAGGSYALIAPGVEFVVRPLAQAAPREDNKPYPGVDPRRVDAAIARGIDWLAKQPLTVERGYSGHAMVLYTMFHAKVNPQHPAFQSLLKTVLDLPLERTYCAAFQAMALSELDPVRYQARIAQCGQFLLDNQNEDGGWGYGETTLYPTPTSSPSKDVATPGAKGRTTRPKNLLTLKRQRFGGPSDNSNSQYATLGLRACLEASVAFPREALEMAKKYWESHQKEDGGWAYSGGGGTSYGTMSVGGLGALIICKHHLGEGWRADPRVLKGIDWIAKNFSVTANPAGQGWYYYYMYALERAGVFTNLRTFGDHDWYKEGANHLLGLQNADGSWHQTGVKESSGPVPDTCWAILFLRKRTPPLQDVASVDRFNVREAGK